MKYIVINRTSDIERKNYITTLFGEMGITPTFFTAIEGSCLNYVDTSFNNIKAIECGNMLYFHDVNTRNPVHKSPPNFNYFGASISHFKVYEQLVMDEIAVCSAKPPRRKFVRPSQEYIEALALEYR